MEDHIYDTVVLAKSFKRTLPNSHYTPQPSLQYTATEAAEYEVPVTRHSGLSSRQANGSSQQQPKCSVNHVYLDMYTGQASGDSSSTD